MSITISVIRDESDKITGFSIIAHDITERKKAEEELRNAYSKLKEAELQLVHSAKMASIGLLATSVAHEINNPLFAISGEAQILLKYAGKDKETRDVSKIIIEQADRIKKITEKLLVFSRKKATKRQSVDVNRVIDKAIDLLSYQANMSNIKITKELGINLPKPLGDEVQLQEVFLNIMLNAAQAMKDGGQLTIRTYSDTVISYGRRRMDRFKFGDKIVAVEIKDTGEGMDAEKLGRLFEPFFTTKDRGVGLGLFISYGIVEAHKGAIDAESRPGEGSVFTVKLPVV
jgi:two-component system, NtrC family, sensor kinase